MRAHPFHLIHPGRADETLKVLMSRVFCVFGFPLVMVSDNNSTFRNSLAAAMAKYFGYRHVFILPYNAQANGMAEASVKRIKLIGSSCY